MWYIVLNKLSDKQIKLAKFPLVKHLCDGGGLSVTVSAVKKVFKFRYQRPSNKKINNIVIGQYPTVTLKKAREIAQSFRENLLEGYDPQYLRKGSGVVFDDLVQKYFAKNADWSEKHRATTVGRYENYIKNSMGMRDARTIVAADIYDLLEAVAKSGSYQTAEKLSYIIKGAFDVGAILRMVDYNPAVGVMAQVTKTTKSKRMPHFNLTRKGEQERFGRFLADINSINHTNLAVKTALILSPYLFLRTGNLISLKVDSFDRKNRWLLIYAEDMKKDHSDFIVPLSKQAFKLIDDLIRLTNPQKFIFENVKNNGCHITSEAINLAKRRAGWEFEDVSLHGLRHTAMTYLTEKGYDYEVTELQLHHKLQGVRGVYNMAVHIDKRKEMMQKWADFLDKIRL